MNLPLASSFLSRVVATLVLFAPLAATPPAHAQDIPTPPGMQKVFIHDPVFNMDAYAVYIPVKWHFRGEVLQGSSCIPVPSQVFRASSPDGLTVLEHLPRMDWTWTDGGPTPAGNGSCLPLRQALSAKDFLVYLAGAMKLDYVSDSPYPADIVAMAKKGNSDGQAAMAAKYRAAGMTPPVEALDLARAIVRFKNGSFPMKGLLAVSVDCNQTSGRANPRAPVLATHICNASVRNVHAPEDKFEAALTQLDPHTTGAIEISRWSQAWIANNDRQTQQNINRINAQGAANIASIKASGEQARATMAVQQHTHDEFLATMQRGTDMSMNRTAQNMQARSTATSDWVDYALDQQTVRDPNTGQLTKASSSYSYTWVDSTGKVGYQTNDVNANPNGSLQGTWTRQTVTHGDGSN